MGNNNSRSDQVDVDPDNALDDFEPIDKPASPTFMSSLQKPFNPNDLTTSGVLVDIPEEDKPGTGEKRRSKTTSTAGSSGSTSTSSSASASTSEKKERQGHHHHHHDGVPITQQSDDELLQESLSKDKQGRLQKLQTDQKNRRNKAIEERRKSPPTPSSSADVVQANPFSRFLSVFSVEPQFPNHKRRYEPSESEVGGGEEEDDPKRPKLDPNATPDHRNSPSLQSILLNWLDTHLPPGWPWMAAAAATSTAIVAFLWVSRSTKQRQPLLLPPPPSSSNYKPTTIW